MKPTRQKQPNKARGRLGKPKTGGRKPGTLNRETAAIRERLLRDERLTVESTVEAMRRGQQYDARRLFHRVGPRKGQLRAITDLSEEEAWCIAGFEIIVKNAAAGDGHTDTVHKVKLVDRGRYVELAAKHLGMLKEQVELSGDQALIEALLAGRKRAAESAKRQ